MRDDNKSKTKVFDKKTTIKKRKSQVFSGFDVLLRTFYKNDFFKDLFKDFQYFSNCFIIIISSF